MDNHRENYTPPRSPRWHAPELVLLALAALLAVIAVALLLYPWGQPSTAEAEQDIADDLVLAAATDPYQRRRETEARQADRVRKAYEQGRRDAADEGCARKRRTML